MIVYDALNYICSAIFVFMDYMTNYTTTRSWYSRVIDGGVSIAV